MFLPQMSTRVSHHPQDFSHPVSPSPIILLSCELTSPPAFWTLLPCFIFFHSTYRFLINCITSFFVVVYPVPPPNGYFNILFIIESSMSRHIGNHSSTTHRRIFFIHASSCTCLIIYWELIPRVKGMHKLPRKVLTISSHQGSTRMSFSWYLHQHHTLVTLSFLFLQLYHVCPPLMHLYSLLDNFLSRIRSCHTFTWFNSSYYLGRNFSCHFLGEDFRDHQLLSNLPVILCQITLFYFHYSVSLADIFLLLYLFVCLWFPSLECKLHENRRFRCLFQHYLQ